jgi:indole-3-glycerol phosphate synthase
MKVISESGIRDRRDVERLERAGVRGILVGEVLMRASDPASKIKELLNL